MDEGALRYLQDHLEHFKEIENAFSESTVVVLPEGAKLASLENYQVAPNRVTQHPQLVSSDSFVEYVNRFKQSESEVGEETTTIYMNIDAGAFLGVIDHHSKSNPAWCSHCVTFKPRVSLEWEAWKAVHGQKLSQLDLAHFIEANLADIIEPEANEMLASALKFEAVENMTLGSAQNLDDGSVKFNFTKENANATVTFPHRMTIVIPLHENEALISIDVRVRYKTTSDGVLTFTMSMVENPRKIERDALVRLANDIKAGTDGVPVYEGGADR